MYSSKLSFTAVKLQCFPFFFLKVKFSTYFCVSDAQVAKQHGGHHEAPNPS